MDPGSSNRALAAVSSALLLATSVAWPIIAAGVALVTTLALWGLFRRGSIADRAREDYDDGGEAGDDARG